MHALDQQMARRMALTFGLILLVVALSATFSQAARLTDDALEQGLGLSRFGLMILTIMPKMAELVAPLAFGVAVVLVCVQRNDSGTTLLLRAAGRAPLRDVSWVAGLALLASAGLIVASSNLIPSTQSVYRTLFAQAQDEGLARATVPVNQPFALSPGLTARVGGHAADGVFLDVLVVDHSEAKKTTLFRADTAALTRTPDGDGVLELRGGEVKEVSGQGVTGTSLQFAQTSLPVALPLSFGGITAPARVEALADTASTPRLIQRWQASRDAAAGEELTRRATAALSLFAFAVLASSVLLSPRPGASGQTRRSVGLLVFLVVFLLLQSALISASGFNQQMALAALGISASPLLIAPLLVGLRGRAS